MMLNFLERKMTTADVLRRLRNKSMLLIEQQDLDVAFISKTVEQFLLKKVFVFSCIESKDGVCLCVENEKELAALILFSKGETRLNSSFDEINGKTFNDLPYVLINSFLDRHVIINAFQPSVSFDFVNRFCPLSIDEDTFNTFWESDFNESYEALKDKLLKL